MSVRIGDHTKLREQRYSRLCKLDLVTLKPKLVMATASKVSRDDFRKRRELDEARKAGTAPAEVDEEGK